MANEAIEHKIDSLIELVKKNNPNADTEMILKAYHLADGPIRTRSACQERPISSILFRLRIF